MTRVLVAFSTLLVLLAHPAWPQQQVWHTNESIDKSVGSVRLQVQRDNRLDAHPRQFVAWVRQGGGGVDGEHLPDERETDAAQFFDADQIDTISDPLEPLSAWMVRRVLAKDFNLLQTNEYGPFVPSPTYL